MKAYSGIGSADSHAIRYRPDIDGLRAIAVWSVVLFHLSSALLPVGYLGVDMFFVLSGYLITSIIWKELSAGAFSIVAFYDRRIRRIMPALLLLIAVVTAVSAIILLPADLIGYARSVLACLGFVANVYFWRDTDYFSRAAETKPLLHIWSLGVEEQFYILFPLVLWLVLRFRRQPIVSCVLALTLVSLAADIALRRAGAVSPAFYLLPTRAWELGVGALVAVLPETVVLRSNQAQAVSFLGAALLLIGMLNLVSSASVLPAAMVVFGTGAIVLAGRHSVPSISRALALRPLVFFGWISYSLYLWHWPVIVLAQYYLVREFHPGEGVFAALLMVGLALASWRFVERPFREKSMPIVRVRWVACAAVVSLAFVAVGFITERGLPSRLNAAAAAINEAVDTNYRCKVSDLVAFGASHACAMNLPSRNPADADLVLLGNSHAQMYAPLWRQLVAERGGTGLLVPINSCLPTVTVNSDSTCFEPARRNLTSVLALLRVKTIVIGLTWDYGPKDLIKPDGSTADNREDMALAAGLDDLIETLEASGKRVILIGPIAEPGYDIASDLSRNLAFGHPVTKPTATPVEEFRQRFGPIVAHFEARKDMVFARPDSVLCHGGSCSYVMDGHAVFSDSNHIAIAALPMFKPLFERAYLDASALLAPSLRPIPAE